MKISIIMPVFNGVRYLDDAIESIRRQTFCDWELICVDDGSSDGARELLLQKAQTDGRITVLLNETNQGPGLSRQRALDTARGDYVMFCDSDDMYHPEMCEEMLRAIIGSKADFVQCYCDFRFETVEQSPARLGMPAESYFNPHVRWWHFFRRPHRGINSLCWLKIIRRSFLSDHGIAFHDGQRYEDAVFCVKCALSARKTVILPEKLYTYRVRPNSLMQSELKDDAAHWRQCSQDLLKWSYGRGAKVEKLARRRAMKWGWQ